ncbi:MAG: hypothetical protein MUC83_11465, partial [Pirellula sp.]|nr:hypothetical protein [Pirellula sp.]
SWNIRIFDSPSLLCALARVLIDVALDRDIILSFGERFPTKSYYFPLRNRMERKKGASKEKS